MIPGETVVLQIATNGSPQALSARVGTQYKAKKDPTSFRVGLYVLP